MSEAHCNCEKIKADANRWYQHFHAEHARAESLAGQVSALLNGVRAALLCRTPFNAVATLEAIIVDANGSGIASAAAAQYEARIRLEVLEEAAKACEQPSPLVYDNGGPIDSARRTAFWDAAARIRALAPPSPAGAE